MKIYFAGPLFTPYVRRFISEHAQVLREHGIDPFVPHEKFNSLISPDRVQAVIEQGLVAPHELDNGSASEVLMNLVRKGRLTREQLGLPPINPEIIFDTDYEGLSTAQAVLAILDGTQVDDGTACEIGIFCALMHRDPAKKGIVGYMTDSRGLNRSSHGYGLNMFVLGVLEECGAIYDDFDDVVKQLVTWKNAGPTLGHAARTAD